VEKQIFFFFFEKKKRTFFYFLFFSFSFLKAENVEVFNVARLKGCCDVFDFISHSFFFFFFFFGKKRLSVFVWSHLTFPSM
jgi:hypothetical protein